MEDVRGNIKSLKLLIIVWLLAVGFSAVMLTISLIYDIKVSLIVSVIVGVFSLIGIAYTSSLIIKLANHLKFLEYKVNN